MALSDLFGLSSSLGQPLTPEQLAALPYLSMPQQGAQPPTASAPQAQGAAPAASAPMPHGFLGVGSPVRDFLGHLGDALLVGSGEKPAYQGRIDDRETQGALQNYMGDPAGSIAKLMRVNAPLGISLLAANAKAKQEADMAKPDAVRELLAAGIDPSSDEGKAALQAHLGKAPVAGIAEYQYYKAGGGRLPFADFLRIIHPPGGGTFEETGGGAPSPAPSSGGALRYNPQTGGWSPE
jgi:hypothetical protein